MDTEVEQLADKGTNYMLAHPMYQRITSQVPISVHIMDIIFP